MVSSIISPTAFGMTMAMFGNIIIGCGITLQKFGLNQQAQSMPSSTTIAASNVAQLKSSFLLRLTNPFWVAGILACAMGDLSGNVIGLMYASPALITPLSILSVLSNTITASIWLHEPASTAKYQGFVLIGCGVLLLLRISPELPASEWASEGYVQSILLATRTRFLLLLVACVIGRIIHVIYSRPSQNRIELYAIVCSLFGTVSILSLKLLSGLPNSSRDTLFPSKTISKDENAFSSIELFQHILASTAALCIIGQEIFKQLALSKFSSSAYVPLSFAFHNTGVAIANLILFQGIHSFIQGVWFTVCFIAAMLIIMQGFKMGLDATDESAFPRTMQEVSDPSTSLLSRSRSISNSKNILNRVGSSLKLDPIVVHKST